MDRVPLKDIDDTTFIFEVSKASSIRSLLENLGFSRNSGTMGNIARERIKYLDINTDHFTNGGGAARYTIEQICIEHSTYTNISRLKIRLITEKYKKYLCELCGNKGIHLGKSLSLQLDHINGVCSDHRLDNIRFLCPNCHSQTDTYGGKNIGLDTH